jgi:SAM-dependent methyltransferase
MQSSETLTQAGHGEAREWNAVWQSLDDAGLSYTAGTPQKINDQWQRWYFDDLWELIAKDRPAGEYLEQGAGRGTTSLYLAKRGRRVTLLDLAPEGRELASRNFARVGLPPPNYILADARRTGLPENSYDCIYNIGLLEHFDDPQPLLHEAYRLLKPGGWMFMVIVPTIPEGRRWLMQLLFRPWTLLPARWKRSVKHVSGMAAGEAAASMTRTELGPADYLRCLEGLRVERAACIPYNPYHQIYAASWYERGWMLPWLRNHQRLKRMWTTAPWLQTSESLASCYLLLVQKGAVPEIP